MEACNPTTLQDIALGCRVAYKPSDDVNHYLNKWHTSLQLVDNYRIHHHNIYVLKNLNSGELGLVMSGSDNAHNWGRNVQRAVGAMPQNVVERLDGVIRDATAKYGSLSWYASHSGGCEYLSASSEALGSTKVFFNPGEVVPDANTIMFNTPKDWLTKYTGQGHDCIPCESGKHGIKGTCEAIPQELRGRSIEELKQEFGFGNQRLKTGGPNSILLPKQQDPFERGVADRYFKQHKESIYEQFKKDHPEKFDRKKGHPTAKADRERLKKQARSASVADPKLQQELAQHRGLADTSSQGIPGRVVPKPALPDSPDQELPGSPIQAMPDKELSGSPLQDTPDQELTNDAPRHVTIGERPTPTAPPLWDSLFDNVQSTANQAFWCTATGSLVISTVRYCFTSKSADEEARPSIGSVVTGAVEQAAEMSGVATVGQMVGNALTYYELGLLGSVAPLLAMGTYQIFRPASAPLPVCRPATIDLAEYRDGLQSREPLTHQSLTGLTRQVFTEYRRPLELGGEVESIEQVAQRLLSQTVSASSAQ